MQPGQRGFHQAPHSGQNFLPLSYDGPYALSLEMSFLLEELGHCLTDEERVSFYLTNTLIWRSLIKVACRGYPPLLTIAACWRSEEKDTHPGSFGQSAVLRAFS